MSVLKMAGVGGALLVLTAVVFSHPPGSFNNSSATATPALSEQDLVTRAVPFKYDDTARNPTRWEGKPVKGRGKVIQVSEGWGNDVLLRVEVSRKFSGFWDDAVLMRY